MERLEPTNADLARLESLGDDLEAALANLPADQRDALRARVLDEHTYPEIARPAHERVALFTEGQLTGQSCRPLQTRPDAKRPCDIGTGFGNAEELEGDDAFLERARAERRLLAGRTTIYGQCSADVERVTLETPRDVRTMLPSAVGHAVLAVYDGDFVGGGGTFIAHLRGGRTWKQELMLGGP